MKNKRLIIVACGVPAALILFFVSEASAERPNPLDLTKEQVALFEEQTKKGDFGACLHLSDYFCLVKDDPKSAAHWWEVLVNLGTVEAIVEVGDRLMEAGDLDAAEKWLLRAKENGDSSADESLAELAKKRAASIGGGAAKKSPITKTDTAPPTGPADPSDPKTAGGYIERAKTRIKERNLPAAIADADRAIDLDPKNALAYFERAEAKGYEGNLDSAIADYTRAIELDPNDARTYSARGFLKGTGGDIEGLFADASRAVELDPKNASGYAFRAIAERDKGDLESAIADDTRAIELRPAYDNAYGDRGFAKAKKGDLQGAISDYTRAIELSPESSDHYLNRAFAEMLARQWPAALDDCRKFCALPHTAFQQDYPRLSIWLIRARLGETEAASRELSAYLEKRNNDICAPWAKKVAEFLLDKIDEPALFAAAESPDAKQTSAQRCDAWYYAGMKKLLSGDHAAAVDDFQKCVATEQRSETESDFAKAELKALQQ